MESKQTNSNKMLQVVLSDPKLMEYGKYNAMDYETLDEALNSDNATVVAVAKIIKGHRRGYSTREIYNEVSNYLNTNLL